MVYKEKDLHFVRVYLDRATFGDYRPNTTAALYAVSGRKDWAVLGYVQQQPETKQWYAWSREKAFWVSFGKTRAEAAVALANATADDVERYFIPVNGRAIVA